ncbi:MAG: phosphoribosylanthranilate isomerase [Bryobacteraceae bacterium]
MMVKVCGITNRDDALAAVDAGVSALGFNFYAKSPRYISREIAAAIANGLPAHVWRVGVFVNEPPEQIAITAQRAALDVAQLHGDENPAAYPAGIRVWKAMRVSSATVDFDVPAEAVLLDGPAGEVYGGAGKTFDWSLAAIGGRRIIVSGGLDASNVTSAIRLAKPWGVDACSRIESSPGRKDHQKMRDFIRAALECQT